MHAARVRRCFSPDLVQMARPRHLTEEMIFQRTKCNRMDLIRNLNLWGNDLCQIAALRDMPNLEVLSLSVNRIESLADLRFCPKLTELYLRKNNISDLGEMRHIRGLKHLKVLWLSDNPCATLPQYRTIVLHHLPGLTKLDSTDVTEDERRQAARADVASMQTYVESEYEPASCADVQGRLREDRQPGPEPHGNRRFSAPPDVHDERRWRPQQSQPTYYENQYADTHVQQSQPYHGYAEPSDMLYDEPAAELPRPNTAPHPAQNAGYGNRSSELGAGFSRSAGHPGSRGPNEAIGGQPRPAWGLSGDSPETPERVRRGQSMGGDSSNGDSCGPQQRSRLGGSVDRPPPELPPYACNDYGEESPANGRAAEGDIARADNILCAVLALIKELDQPGLELVRRAIEQRQADL